MFYSSLILFTIIITISKAEIDVNSNTEYSTKENIYKRIAIIGGGLGGSSAAYFLNDLVKNHDSIKISVDLFEKNPKLGGRIATKTINGKQYEIGAHLLDEKNKYATYLINQLKLSKQESKISPDKTCIYNGKYYLFCESYWEWFTSLKAWFRYGFELKTLLSKVSKIIDLFDNIYKLQENNVKFDSVDEMLDSISPTITNLSKTTMNDFLVKSGFSERIINEFVQSLILSVSNQDISITALTGLIAVSVLNSQAFSISGGFKQFPEKLAQESNANILLKSNVIAIKYLGPNRFELVVKTEPNTITRKIYSSVIIATPLFENHINFLNFSNHFDQNIPIRKYNKYVITLVTGTVKKEFKGINVLNYKKSSSFTALSRVRPVDQSDDDEMPVYRVLSQSPLTPKQLYFLFWRTYTVEVTEWVGIPVYENTVYPFPKFTLFPGVYYINAIEWATTSLEMTLISGKNGALLVYNQLGGNTSTVNTKNIINNQIFDEL